MDVQCVETENLFSGLKKKYNFKIGEGIFTAPSLTILKDLEDIQSFNHGGAYFIFTTLPKNKVFCFSRDGYQCMESYIQKKGNKFRCIYNGIHKSSVKRRLTEHLFNPRSKEKVINGKNDKIPHTGALSLETISAKELNSLTHPINSSYIKGANRLKAASIPRIKENSRFYNGINIEEKRWKPYNFGVVVLKSDNNFGLNIIEQVFRDVNGLPPLCMT